MQVYSRSQGKVIEVPDDQVDLSKYGAPPSSPLAGGQLGGLLSGAGENQSQLQQLLSLGVLSGDVSPSSITALQSLNMMPTTQETKELRQKKADVEGAYRTYSDSVRRIQEAKQMIQGQKDISGGLGRLGIIRKASEKSKGLRGILKMVGLGKGAEKNTQALSTKLSTINEELFKVAGKALTGTEAEILSGKILGIDTEEDVLLERLNQLEREAQKQQMQLLSL